MKMNYDNLHAGHFGVTKTMELIYQKYHWLGITQKIKDYIIGCDVCQRMKAPCHKPYGEMQPLPILSQLWESISMNIIIELPPSADADSKAYNAILMVVDRFMKMAKYFPVRTIITAADLAKLFYQHIVCFFGMPSSIVMDHGSLFTSQYWSSLYFHIKARRKLSTAFHPQTDGQMERQNQTLEHYLYCYINYRQDD